jgi:hypothetical protein
MIKKYQTRAFRDKKVRLGEAVVGGILEFWIRWLSDWEISK